MSDQGRRRFFRSVFTAGAALAAGWVGGRSGQAEGRAAAPGIEGLCLYVPSLGQASDFVAAMSRNAPGKWTAHALRGPLTACYFDVRRLYEGARGKANTFVGVVDAATFAVVHEAIVDGGGSFHYVSYEDRNRVTFSAQV
jgi:hypothetical protein